MSDCVLVAARARLLAEVLARALDGACGVEARATTSAETEAEAFARARGLVLLLDRHTSLAEATATVAAFRRGGRECVVTVSEGGDIRWRRIADQVGAVAHCTWASTPTSLAESVRRALAGDGVRRRRTARRAAGAASDPRLTRREAEVIRLLAGGRRADQIATSLGISPNTVRTHLQNAMGKMGVTSRLQAVSVARRHGLLAANGHEVPLP